MLQIKKKLGESRQNDSAITSIQLIQTPVIPGTKSIEQQYSSTLECESSCMDGPCGNHTYFAAVEEKSVTPTTYTVVTTEKQVKLSYDVNIERALM